MVMTNRIHERVTEAIGAEAARELDRCGLTVLDAEELEQYVAQQDAEKERLRELVRAAADAFGGRAMRVEVSIDEHRGRILVTDPGGNEAAMTRTIATMVVAVLGGRFALGEVYATDTRPAATGAGVPQ